MRELNMELEEFSKEFIKLSEGHNLELDKEKINKFYNYMNLLREWNEKINLTAITEPREVIIKHFIDCLTISKNIDNNAKIIDVGTGAGFPGIPLKIYDESLKLTLLDSLNKRTIFLKEVVNKLELKNVEIVHGRAEDFAQDKSYRESYDYAVSRAVAPLNILLEYLVPYIKVNGKVIAMKGTNVTDEVKNSEKALKLLESKIISEEKILLPENSGERYIITVQKINKTNKIYPRKAGIPKKNPL